LNFAVKEMEYEAFETERCPGDWCVEARATNGNFSRAYFSGPTAQKDATEYAAWKNAQKSASMLNQSWYNSMVGWLD